MKNRGHNPLMAIQIALANEIIVGGDSYGSKNNLSSWFIKPHLPASLTWAKPDRSVSCTCEHLPSDIIDFPKRLTKTQSLFLLINNKPFASKCPIGSNRVGIEIRAVLLSINRYLPWILTAANSSKYFPSLPMWSKDLTPEIFPSPSIKWAFPSSKPEKRYSLSVGLRLSNWGDKITFPVWSIKPHFPSFLTLAKTSLIIKFLNSTKFEGQNLLPLEINYSPLAVFLDTAQSPSNSSACG